LAQNAVLSWHVIGKGPAGTTETLETWSWVRGDLGVLGPGGLGSECLQLTSVVPAGLLVARIYPGEVGVSALGSSSAAQRFEQRTKPSSLDGCPMFAKAYMAEKDGAKPHKRYNDAGDCDQEQESLHME
jgi:hypothetical protein